jgi:O-antigen ligase
VTAVSAAALFLAARWAARRHPVQVLFLVTIPAAVNASLAILQELKIWNGIAPFEARDLHAGTTALLGNPNDVGSFLVPGLVATAAWILATKRIALRLLLTPLALLMIGGLAASRTRGAFLGAAVGLAVLAVVRWRVRALLWTGAAAVVAGLIAAASPALVGNVFDSPVEMLLSGRAIAFASAWRMFTESPLFGVGPGNFVYAYFDYASAVQASMIEYAIAGRQLMFGEAHNDHLQVLAETGIVGYALFIASLVTLIAVSRPKMTAASSERLRFARLCGAPLAASLAALGLFQFPLYLAAPMVVFVFVAGLIVGWSEDETLAA